MIYLLNLKSHFTKESFLAYQEEIRKFPSNPHVVFAPPTCFLPYLEGFSLASQDISAYPEGSYTGEVNGKMLSSLGVQYVLIGHSERRNYFHESELLLKKKVEEAIASGITPVLCIGESQEIHQSGKTLEFLEGEVSFLSTFPQDVWKKIILAYEPIWAIGTGKVIEKESLEKIVSFLKERYSVPVFYGGSLTFDLLQEFKSLQNLDGFLIGGMSLKVEEVKKLLQES